MVRRGEEGVIEEPELAWTFLCCDMNKIYKTVRDTCSGWTFCQNERWDVLASCLRWYKTEVAVGFEARALKLRDTGGNVVPEFAEIMSLGLYQAIALEFKQVYQISWWQGAARLCWRFDYIVSKKLHS